MYALHVAMQAAAPLYLQATYRGSIIQLAFSIAQRHEQPPVAPQLNRAQSVLMGHQRKEKTRQDKTRQDKTRQDKTRQDKTRQDKTRQDYAFWHEKPSIIPGCPGWVINTAVYTCRGGMGGAPAPADAATHARHPATAAAEVAAAVLAR